MYIHMYNNHIWKQNYTHGYDGIWCSSASIDRTKLVTKLLVKFTLSTQCSISSTTLGANQSAGPDCCIRMGLSHLRQRSIFILSPSKPDMLRAHVIFYTAVFKFFNIYKNKEDGRVSALPPPTNDYFKCWHAWKLSLRTPVCNNSHLLCVLLPQHFAPRWCVLISHGLWQAPAKWALCFLGSQARRDIDRPYRRSQAQNTCSHAKVHTDPLHQCHLIVSTFLSKRNFVGILIATW